VSTSPPGESVKRPPDHIIGAAIRIWEAAGNPSIMGRDEFIYAVAAALIQHEEQHGRIRYMVNELDVVSGSLEIAAERQRQETWKEEMLAAVGQMRRLSLLLTAGVPSEWDVDDDAEAGNAHLHRRIAEQQKALELAIEEVTDVNKSLEFYQHLVGQLEQSKGWWGRIGYLIYRKLWWWS
jgi:hypothetical protein